MILTDSTSYVHKLLLELLQILFGEVNKIQKIFIMSDGVMVGYRPNNAEYYR